MNKQIIANTLEKWYNADSAESKIFHENKLRDVFIFRKNNNKFTACVSLHNANMQNMIGFESEIIEIQNILSAKGIHGILSY